MCKVLCQLNGIINPFVTPICVEKYIKHDNQCCSVQSKDNSEEKELSPVEQPTKTLDDIKECDTNQVKCKSKKKGIKKIIIPIYGHQLAANSELTKNKDDVSRNDADVTMQERGFDLHSANKIKESKPKNQNSKKNTDVKSNGDKENNSASTICTESHTETGKYYNKVPTNTSSINESKDNLLLNANNRPDATALTSENVKSKTKSKKTNKKLSNDDINDHENVNTHDNNDDKSKSKLISIDKGKCTDSLTIDSTSKSKPKDENNSNVDTNKEVDNGQMETNKKNKTKTEPTNNVQNDNSVKKTKNNKKGKNVAEFVKANSECSSESDKVRVNNNHLLDMTHLERTLNELHRIVEKLDKVNIRL